MFFLERNNRDYGENYTIAILLYNSNFQLHVSVVLHTQQSNLHLSHTIYLNIQAIWYTFIQKIKIRCHNLKNTFCKPGQGLGIWIFFLKASTFITHKFPKSISAEITIFDFCFEYELLTI